MKSMSQESMKACTNKWQNQFSRSTNEQIERTNRSANQTQIRTQYAMTLIL